MCTYDSQRQSEGGDTAGTRFVTAVCSRIQFPCSFEHLEANSYRKVTVSKKYCFRKWANILISECKWILNKNAHKAITLWNWSKAVNYLIITKWKSTLDMMLLELSGKSKWTNRICLDKIPFVLEMSCLDLWLQHIDLWYNENLPTLRHDRRRRCLDLNTDWMALEATWDFE